MKAINKYVGPFIFFAFSSIATGQQLTAHIEVALIDSQRTEITSNEYHIDMYARVFNNGNVVAERDTNYKYIWYYKDVVNNDITFTLDLISYGNSYFRTDGHIDTTKTMSIIDYFCVIEHRPTGVITISDTVRTPYYCLIVNQKMSDDHSAGMVKFWNNGSFSNHHSVPDTFLIARHLPKILLADTSLTVSKEKYWNWTEGTNVSWNNNKQLVLPKLITSTVSHFRNSNNAFFSISIDSLSFEVSNTFEFLDPWLRDSVNLFGILNRSVDAIFKKQTTPFSPNTDTSGLGSEYRGVFLNQEVSSDNPYYYIRTKRNSLFDEKRIFFQHWASSQADLITPIAYDGIYYETPIVFRQNNSSVVARYKGSLFSNHSSAFSNTSQRKVIDLSTSYGARLFVVYESMGKIWIEYSTNNGQSWELGNNRQPLNSYSGKLPSIASYNNSNTLAIVNQEANENGSWISCQKYDVYSNLASSSVMIGFTRSSNANSNPVVAQSFSGNNNDARLMFAWEQNDGIHYMIVRTILDTIKFGTIDWDNQPKVSGTDACSYSPSLAGGWTTQNYNFHLAWSQNNTDIMYVKIQQQISTAFEQITFGALENVSLGSGYSSNYSPSIISIVSTSQSKIQELLG